MKKISIVIYVLLYVLALFNAYQKHFDEACFDLLLAFGIRQNIKDSED